MFNPCPNCLLNLSSIILGLSPLATLVNSQMVCLQLVGVLINHVHFKIMFVSVVICEPR